MALADDLVQAARQAMLDTAGPLPNAAVVATLRVLVDKHFPDDNVDYHYATEGLAQDACDALAELERGEDGT